MLIQGVHPGVTWLSHFQCWQDFDVWSRRCPFEAMSIHCLPRFLSEMQMEAERCCLAFLFMEQKDNSCSSGTFRESVCRLSAVGWGHSSQNLSAWVRLRTRTVSGSVLPGSLLESRGSKENRFFHYCFFNLRFQTNLKAFNCFNSSEIAKEKMWKYQSCFGFQKILRASLFLVNSKVTHSQSDKQKDKALSKGQGMGGTEGLQ